MISDLTFFTNEPNEALLDRFKATLTHVQYFDVLVGYFRTSGFNLLYKLFENVEKIRILVGLNIDRKTFELIEQAEGQLRLNFESHQQTQQAFSNSLTREMEHAPDTYDTETGVKKFVEFIQSGKLEIKAHPSQNIHAKVYISRFPETHYDYGRVITGSSNFSQSGLVGNYEFNVELKNRAVSAQKILEGYNGVNALFIRLTPKSMRCLIRRLPCYNSSTILATVTAITA